MAAVSGKRKRNKINKDNAGYFFIAPYFIVFLTFTLYPILYTFKLSFMSWDGFGEQQFIGLANYQRLLQDQMFIKSIGNTIFIALLAMIPQMVFGLVLAFLLNQKKLRGSNFFKTVFYFPNLVTAVSLGVLFSLLFDWKAGSVNQVLMTLHIIKDPINWKGSPLLSQLIVALVLFGSILDIIPLFLQRVFEEFHMNFLKLLKWMELQKYRHFLRSYYRLCVQS